MTAHDGGVHCRELALSDPAWDAADGDAFAVLQQLRAHLDRDAFDRDVFDRIHHAGAAQGLRYSGAFDASGRCLGVAGRRILHTTSFGWKLYIDDLVTAGTERSRGIGTTLLDHLTDIARDEGCAVVDLDSGHQRLDAHRFYRGESFDERSLHFTRPVDPA